MTMPKTARSRMALGLAMIAALAACNSTPPQDETPWLVGYTCCNLRYDSDWISDANYSDLPFIPAGTPIAVMPPAKDSYRAYATIAGRPFRLGLDYGRPVQGTEQWVSKIVLRDDPRINNAAWSLEVRQAIAQGKIMPGMSKEQVITSLGYPLPTKTPNLDSNVWRYSQNATMQYDVYWENERVAGVTKATDDKGGLPLLPATRSRH